MSDYQQVTLEASAQISGQVPLAPLSLACPRCGSEIGVPCRSPLGTPLREGIYHDDRIAALVHDLGDEGDLVDSIQQDLDQARADLASALTAGDRIEAALSAGQVMACHLEAVVADCGNCRGLGQVEGEDCPDCAPERQAIVDWAKACGRLTRRLRAAPSSGATDCTKPIRFRHDDTPAEVASLRAQLAAQWREGVTRDPPLLCYDCCSAWPDLTPGTETTVVCACGKTFGARSRRTTPPQAQASTPTISDEELDRR